MQPEWLYRAPLWLPTSHAQTIVPALFGRRPAVQFRRERWDTPDGDFIDLDWIAHHENAPAASRTRRFSCCFTASKAAPTRITPAC